MPSHQTRCRSLACPTWDALTAIPVLERLEAVSKNIPEISRAALPLAGTVTWLWKGNGHGEALHKGHNAKRT